MKRTLLCAILALCGLYTLCAQNVLPGYRGFWESDRRISILDLVEDYPGNLPYLRNEIYARYGRPFVNQTYRDYFGNRSWYQVKNNFAESWLSRNDQANAEFIAALEQSSKKIDDVINIVLKNIEYTDGEAVLTFISRYELIWTDDGVSFGHYAVNWYGSHKELPWAVMGDWFLVYQLGNVHGEIDVAAYRLDHASRRIVSSVAGSVDESVMLRLLRSQDRIVPKR